MPVYNALKFGSRGFGATRKHLKKLNKKPGVFTKEELLEMDKGLNTHDLIQATFKKMDL